MFTEDDIDRITAAVGTVSLVDPRGEYRERLRAACLSYVNARALEGEALSHLARKLEPIEKGTARTRPTEEIEKLLTAQARASGYQGAVEAATPGERSVWAHAARERLEARVARRQRYGQKPYAGDRAVGAFIGDLFGIYHDVFAGGRYPSRGDQSPVVQFIQTAGVVLGERLGQHIHVTFDQIRRRIPTAKKLSL